MKNYVLVFVAILALSFNSCTSMKDTSKTADLYNTTWELEYISGRVLLLKVYFRIKNRLLNLMKLLSKFQEMQVAMVTALHLH